MAAKNAAQADQAQTDVQAKTDKEIAGGYTGGITKLEGLLTQLTDVRDALREQGVQVGEAGEERRRHQDTALYDMAQERKAVTDKQKEQDAERAAAHKARETALRDGEEELLTALGVSRDAEGKVPVVKTIRDALDQKLKNAETSGVKEGAGAAKKEYEAAKALDVANAKADKTIQDAKVASLTADNTRLAAENTRLLEAQQAQLTAMKDVAIGSLNAAAGMTGKATESLQTAAAGGNGQGRPVR